MPIASSLFARPCRSTEVGNNASQISRHRPDTLTFGSHREQFLFEVQIERQRARQIIRKRPRTGRGKILHRPGQRQNLQVKLNRPRSVLRGRSARFDFIRQQQYVRLQESALPVQFEHRKALASLRNQIETPVGILFRNADNLRGASNVCDAALHGAHYAKGRMVCPTLTNHLFIPRLENVQRQGSAGQQYDVKREQGKHYHEVSNSSARTAARAVRLYAMACTTWLSPTRGSGIASPTYLPSHLDLPSGGEYNPNMELAGKVVVVTGASMGIGEAIAKLFAGQGASVVLLSRDAGRAEAARLRIGCPERTVALSCDVRHSEEIDRVLGLTLHHFKRVDVWISNAGHGLIDSVAELDMAACHAMFETNFFGALSAMQAVIPVMRQQGGGTIINISSVAGHIPLPFHAAYSATKFALNAMGKAAGVELKKDGIHVLTVCPGYVRTAFSENAVRGSELKKVRPSSLRGIGAERVARATLRGYLKHKREVIVPWTMHLPVKLYQLFPGMVEWAMGRMAK